MNQTQPVQSDQGVPVQQNQTVQQSQPSPTGKKSNSGLIVVIVIIIILVLFVGGGYFAYSMIKKSVSNAVKTSPSSQPSIYPSSKTTATTSNSGSPEYDEAKDNIPTNTIAIAINSEIKPFLVLTYAGAKLDTWASTTEETANLGYIVQKPISVGDYSKFEEFFTSKGYEKTGNTTSSDGFMYIGKKADNTSIVVNFSISSPYVLVIGVEKLIE